jgi:hypothetical protein
VIMIWVFYHFKAEGSPHNISRCNWMWLHPDPWPPLASVQSIEQLHLAFPPE